MSVLRYCHFTVISFSAVRLHLRPLVFGRLIAIPLIHCLECVVALRRCRKLGISGATTVLWLLQTLAFGIGSLKFLLRPVEDSEAAKKKK